MDKIIIEICITEARKTGIENAIKKGWFNVWTPERIKGAFNYGRGTMADFNRYKKDNNNRYCLIKEIDKNRLLELYPHCNI